MDICGLKNGGRQKKGSNFALNQNLWVINAFNLH